MKPPDAVLWDLIRQWVAKADVDYRTAERLVNDSDPIREAIAFHCQQAVEKYVKALLVSLQIEFPKTHDLEELLRVHSDVRDSAETELEYYPVRLHLLSEHGLDMFDKGVEVCPFAGCRKAVAGESAHIGNDFIYTLDLVDYQVEAFCDFIVFNLPSAR